MVFFLLVTAFEVGELEGFAEVNGDGDDIVDGDWLGLGEVVGDGLVMSAVLAEGDADGLGELLSEGVGEGEGEVFAAAAVKPDVKESTS